MDRKYRCTCVTSRGTFCKEVTLFRQWEQQALAAKQSAIPTSEERSVILLCFDDTYRYLLLYSWNLLAFCSGSPTPVCTIQGMTITFENDKNIITYALEEILSHDRIKQSIFVAQSVWWISGIIGLQEGLVTHIDNLRIRSEVYSRRIETLTDSANIHPEGLAVIYNLEISPEHSNYRDIIEPGLDNLSSASTCNSKLYD